MRNGYQYRCVVKDANGKSVTSNAASITVFAITKQPVSFTGAAGQTAVFSVTATGAGLTYQWQVNKGAGWTDLSASYRTASISVGAIKAD